MAILRNILVVLGAILVGSLLNIGTLLLGNVVVPLPAGTDPMDPESLAAAMPLFTIWHYVFPFLAHAIGTLVGAWIAARFSTSRPRVFALGIGCWFMLGGLINAYTLPGPVWFEVADIVLAYLPTTLLAARLGTR